MSRPITANTERGRILLALRAGRMASEALYERFGSGGTYICELKVAGKIEVRDGFYYIAAEGLRVCPSRRNAPLEPLHADGREYGSQGQHPKSRKHGWASTRQGASV